MATLWEQMMQSGEGRRPRILATPPLPPDSAMDPNHAKTILARCG